MAINNFLCISRESRDMLVNQPGANAALSDSIPHIAGSGTTINMAALYYCVHPLKVNIILQQYHDEFVQDGMYTLHMSHLDDKAIPYHRVGQLCYLNDSDGDLIRLNSRGLRVLTPRAMLRLAMFLPSRQAKCVTNRLIRIHACHTQEAHENE